MWPKRIARTRGCAIAGTPMPYVAAAAAPALRSLRRPDCGPPCMFVVMTFLLRAVGRCCKAASAQSELARQPKRDLRKHDDDDQAEKQEQVVVEARTHRRVDRRPADGARDIEPDPDRRPHHADPGRHDEKDAELQRI